MKKVLSIVLSLAMVVCLMPTMAFAATADTVSASYTDTKDQPCEGAVNVLSALGVVNGYTDGTFKPEQTVTRAEMAKLVVTALGVADYATATTSSYTDMTNAAWAIPFVEYASNLNIIKGYGNGQFGPNDTVTYEQAATMIVRALGYTDECNEMNGLWPAIYIQKATALGIFEDVVNGGAKGADRGDTAIMLFNALDLPEVYADNDGATQYKNGSSVFTGSDGKDFKGTSMLATLNKSGEAAYKVITEDDADDALIDVNNYIGAVGKVYKDKNGDVLAVGDIQTTFLTGTLNSDFDKLTVGDTTYKISSNALKVLTGSNGDAAYSADTFKASDATGTVGVPVFLNNEDQGTRMNGTATGKSGALDKQYKYNKSITLAVKVSGTTINQIYSAGSWTAQKTDLFEDSDATNISKNQKLWGHEFQTTDNGTVDYNTFVLNGVDSLDDIKADNVVAVFYNGDNGYIRKVEVGTKTVEGTLESFTKGTKSTDDNNGAQGTFVIDGTSYKGTNCNMDKLDADDLNSWINQSSDSDDVSVGDVVKGYLDYSGKIYQIEQSEASASDYAIVLNYSLQSTPYTNDNSNAVINNSTTMSGNASKIQVMTANGTVSTFEVKDGADLYYYNGTKDVAVPYSAIGSHYIEVGDIITYDLNSSNIIKKVTIKSQSTLADDATHSSVDDVLRAADSQTAATTISASGTIAGKYINTGATIFVIDNDDAFTPVEAYDISLTAQSNAGTMTEPAYYLDDDNVSVVALSSVLDTDKIFMFGNTTKNSKYSSLIINGSATSNNEVFGVVTSYSTLSSDDVTKYRVTALVNGETVTYNTDVRPEYNMLYRFDFDSKGYVDKFVHLAFDSSNPDAGFMGTALGYITAGTSGITVKSGNVVPGCTKLQGTAADISLESDVKYYEYKAESDRFEVAEKSDLETASNGKIAVFVDTDTSSDRDYVADIVLIYPDKAAANSAIASLTSAADNSAATARVDKEIAKVTPPTTTYTDAGDGDGDGDTDKSAAIAAGVAYVKTKVDAAIVTVGTGSSETAAADGATYTVKVSLTDKTVATVAKDVTITVSLAS